MTAREAYAADDVFRLLIDEWVRERRCPVPLQDRCLELGMESAADCVRWALTTGERRGWEHGNATPTPQGPYPARYETRWFWVAVEPTDKRLGSGSYYFDVRRLVRKINWSTDRFEGVEDAVLWLLDNWTPTDLPDRPKKPRRARR